MNPLLFTLAALCLGCGPVGTPDTMHKCEAIVGGEWLCPDGGGSCMCVVYREPDGKAESDTDTGAPNGYPSGGDV